VAPADMTSQDRKEVEYFVERVLDAIGVEFGATHTEIVLTASGPRIIETHVRQGGDEIPALTLDATGVDLAECVVRQTVGEKVLPDIRAVLAAQRTSRCSAIWFVAAPAAGVLADVRGAEQAAKTGGVTEVKLLARPGDTIGALESSDTRIASIRAIGDTADLAVDAARKAAAHLEFDVRMRAVSAPTV
jgi:biotin carboxylase